MVLSSEVKWEMLEAEKGFGHSCEEETVTLTSSGQKQAYVQKGI